MTAAVAAVVSLSMCATACSTGSSPAKAPTSASANATDGEAPATAPVGDDASAAAPQENGSSTAPASTSSQARVASRFCRAADALKQAAPENPTPEQISAYTKSVEAAAGEMIDSAPDKSIVPIVRNLQAAFGLYATIANTDPGADPAAYQQKVEEATRLFPVEDQKKFALYVKRECGIELPS